MSSGAEGVFTEGYCYYAGCQARGSATQGPSWRATGREVSPAVSRMNGTWVEAVRWRSPEGAISTDGRTEECFTWLQKSGFVFVHRRVAPAAHSHSMFGH